MKQIFLFFTVIIFFQTYSFTQPDNNSSKKVLTKSEDILKAIMQSQNTGKISDNERTLINTIVLDNGYVLVSKMGQYWNETGWVNSSMLLLTYTEEGLKTEEIEQFWENGNWVNNRKYTTTYYVNDLVSLYLEQNWNGVTWENSYRYISSYNANNLLNEYNVEQWNGTGWSRLYKTSYSYSGSGNLETIIDQTWNGTTWDNNYKYTYQYNTNNDVSEELEEVWFDGNWKNSILHTFTYNSQNLLMLDASFWWPDSVWKESVEIYYEYDASGNIIDRLTKFWESEVLGLQNKYHSTFEYLPATNLQTKAENQEWNLQSQVWINTSRDIYVYNSENILIHYSGEGWDGSNWLPGFQENYSIDENGNVDTLLSQYWDGTEWINSYRAIHEWSPVNPVSVEHINIGENNFNLEQNYPNPFNPSTKINYVLPIESFVTIKVYDVIGREVTTIINEVQQSGKHEIEYNAEGLSSGIYFYRMEAGSFISTKKFLLIK